MARRRLLFAACSILLLSAVLPVAVAPGVGRAEDSGGVVAEPAPPAAQADLVAVDPAGDPWLREQGPPVPEPDETPSPSSLTTEATPERGSPSSSTRAGTGSKLERRGLAPPSAFSPEASRFSVSVVMGRDGINAGGTHVQA